MTQAKIKEIVCSSCGKRYWTDIKRAMAIDSKLKADPDYLKNYKCRVCRGGKAKAKSTPTMRPLKETTINISSNGEVKVESKDIPAEHVLTETIGKNQYSQELLLHIPSSAEKYINRYIGVGKGKVKDEDMLMFHYKQTNPLLKNVLLIGETGTGKTALVRHFCWKNKIPYYRVVMNGGTTTEDIIGQQVMKEDGKFKFQFQVLINMMKEGGIFVFDEINAGQKEILHILNSITDFERKAVITQHDGEVIQATDNFLVVACMNPPSEYDLQEMSISLKSRFCPYYFDYDDKVDRQVIQDEKLLNFAKAIRTARLNKQVNTPLSTRDLVQFKILREGLGYEVAKEMMVNKFHNGEKQVIRTALEYHLEKSNILDKKKDKDN